MLQFKKIKKQFSTKVLIDGEKVEKSMFVSMPDYPKDTTEALGIAEAIRLDPVASMYDHWTRYFAEVCRRGIRAKYEGRKASTSRRSVEEVVGDDVQVGEVISE